MQSKIQSMFDNGNFEEAIEAYKMLEKNNPTIENPIIAHIVWRKLWNMLQS